MTFRTYTSYLKSERESNLPYNKYSHNVTHRTLQTVKKQAPIRNSSTPKWVKFIPRSPKAKCLYAKYTYIAFQLLSTCHGPVRGHMPHYRRVTKTAYISEGVSSNSKYCLFYIHAGLYLIFISLIKNRVIQILYTYIHMA